MILLGHLGDPAAGPALRARLDDAIAEIRCNAALSLFRLGDRSGLGTLKAYGQSTTRGKLLQLAWFRRLYERVMIWLAWARELTDPIKRRLRSWFHMFGPKRAGRTLRLLARQGSSRQYLAVRFR